MRCGKTELILAAIVLASLLFAAWAYPRMPERMATHWNARGEADGYMSRGTVAFFFPFLLAGVGALLLVMPRIDPLRQNLERARKYYDAFVILMAVFLLLVQAHVTLWNLGIRVPIVVFLSPLLGALFYGIGVVCANVPPNWTIGIRTPWTLSSERVWEKTHRHAAKLFRAAGVIALAGLALPRYGFWLAVAPGLAAALWAAVYSYLEYRKEPPRR